MIIKKDFRQIEYDLTWVDELIVKFGFLEYIRSIFNNFTGYDLRLFVPWFPRKKQIFFIYLSDSPWRAFGCLLGISFSWDWNGARGFSKKRKIRLFKNAY